jgi:leader peptidase (prepilin peptidase) / N-methyltransferase
VQLAAQIVLYAIVFALGAVIGSFLNVCIYRIPRGKSISKPPRSYCPTCHEFIVWYDNIPLVSYLALGRCCRRCGSLISPRYFIVELLTAAGFAGIYWMLEHREISSGVTGETPGVIAVYLALFCLLVVASFIDLELRIIPDELTFGGMAVVPLLALAIPALHNAPLFGRDLLIFDQEHMRLGSLCASLLGMVVGPLVIYGSGVLGKVIFRKEAMGMGDVKYMAVLGGLLGWKLTLLAFFASALYGAVVGVIAILKTRDHHIPYGPFLSAGALTAMLAGGPLLAILSNRLAL